MAFRLERGESLGGGLRRVALEQMALAVETLRGEPDALRAAHEARRRSKEVRAALRLQRDALPAQSYVAAMAMVRAAAQRLAPARDAEVAIAALAELRRHQRLLRRERVEAEQALAARLDAARAALTREALDEVAALFGAAATALPPGDGGELATLVEDRLRRLYRRGGRRMREAQRTGSAEAYHAWRHDAKDLGYVTRLLAAAWEGPLEALAGELQAIGKVLGAEHDLSILHAALAASPGEPSPLTPRLARAIQRRQQTLRARARTLGARLWAERPRAFAGRVLAYWSAWRDDA